MKNKKKSDDSLQNSRERKSFAMIYKLSNTFIQLELIFTILLFLLYLMGNFQQFQNKTQILILNVLSVNSVTMAIMSLFCLLQIVVFSVIEKKFMNKIFHTLFSVIGFVTGSIFTVLATVIIKISIGLI